MMAEVVLAAHNERVAGIPIKALSATTIDAISVLMDPVKVLPNDEGLPRYWRGLAHIIGLQGDTVSLLTSQKNPTKHVLNMWTSGTLESLKAALQRLDRWDVFDDTSHMMDEDAVKYETEKDEAEKCTVSSHGVNLALDKQIITVGDVNRLGKGLSEPQHYHAFLLHAEEDHDFASQIINKMENEFGLKLCVRDRDLVGGLAFEHEAIMRLIKERCHRLIVIVSPNFLKSEANKFFVTFAQALGIGQRERKVVPCLYVRCELPPELSYYFLLDYTRPSKLWDFWEKLRDSIQTPPIRTHAGQVEDLDASKSEEFVKDVKVPVYGSSNVKFGAKDTPSLKSLDLPSKSDFVPDLSKTKSKNFLKRMLRKDKLCKEPS